MPKPGRRVVITGMAALTSLSTDLDAFYDELCQGRSGIGPIEIIDTSPFKIKFGGEVKHFDPTEHIPHRDVKKMDRFTQFALTATVRAVKDSGLEIERENPYRVGVILGNAVGGLQGIEDAHHQLQRNPERLSPFMIPRMLVNSASGQISIRYGIKGPTTAVATACASGANAIGDACKIIQRGDADVMISGGTEAAITPLAVAGFIAMRALSSRNDAPEQASRPFDRDRDGFVLSEGAGILVLEEYERARKRNATIYAEVVGYGTSADGIHLTAPDPEGVGASRAMRLALKDAHLLARKVDYINAHGTATPLGDKAETLAIKRVFRRYAQDVAISSTKSQLGHLLGASGGVETIICALALHKNVMPPTINLENPDEGCDLDYIPNQAREKRIEYAMTNSFGFGGHNATLVLRAMDKEREVGSIRRAA